MRVTTEMAMPIIRRLRAFLDYNVNIMDENGVIVASADVSRMYQHHQGALQVLEQHREIVVSVDDAAGMEGTKPGVNLPLEFAGATVGVVGITGLPEHVYPVARITKITVETLLEQLYVQQQADFRRHTIRNWFEELTAHQPDITRLAAVAHTLGIDVSRQRMGVVIAARIADTSPMDSIESQHMVLHKVAHQIHPETLFAVSLEEVTGRISGTLSGTLGGIHADRQMNSLSAPADFNRHAEGTTPHLDVRIWLAVPFPRPSSDAGEVVHNIVKFIQMTYPEDFTVGIGEPQSGLEGYRRSLMQAGQAVRLQTLLQDSGRIYIRDWGTARLLDALPTDSLQEYIAPYQEGINRLSGTGELKTLKAFLELDCNAKETAERLHIHRNTLNYRLQKVTDATGLNPQRFSDAVQLSLLVTAWQMRRHTT